MAYNFKNLSDVELLNIMPEEANVVVEVNGTTKRAPQAKVDVEAELAGTETLTELPETGTVLAEVNGAIKRVPSNKVGGIDAIVFSVVAAAAVGADAEATPMPQTICNHTVDEIGELVSAGANCVFVATMSSSSERSVSTFGATGANPIITTSPCNMTLGLDDNSWVFFFYNDFIGQEFVITYYADGTIENSLFTQQES